MDTILFYKLPLELEFAFLLLPVKNMKGTDGFSLIDGSQNAALHIGI